MQQQASRRQILRGAAAFGLAAAFVPGVSSAESQQSGQSAEKSERDHCLAAGMTDAEAACWIAAADAAGKFFALPEVHPSDKAEVATAIHVLQNKLLGRPTYRRYLESHRGK